MFLLEPGQSAWFYVLTVKLTVSTMKMLVTNDIIGDQPMRALLTKLHDLLHSREQTKTFFHG